MNPPRLDEDTDLIIGAFVLICLLVYLVGRFL
jgi:hypothetical protein